MDGATLALALELARESRVGNGPKTRALAKRYLRTVAATARAEAELLNTLADDFGTSEDDWEQVPGSKTLTYAQLKEVWDGVNEQARRILGAFATHGGAIAPQQLMAVLGIDEPRLLNGPLGGISRRVKKLLGDSEATFYDINSEDGRYRLQQGTFSALCDLIEREQPDALTEQYWASERVHAEGASNDGDTDE